MQSAHKYPSFRTRSKTAIPAPLPPHRQQGGGSAKLPALPASAMLKSALLTRPIQPREKPHYSTPSAFGVGQPGARITGGNGAARPRRREALGKSKVGHCHRRTGAGRDAEVGRWSRCS